METKAPVRRTLGSFLQGDRPEFLPEFLKDFHDAKDFFKTFHDFCREEMAKSREEGFAVPNWVDGQVYTVDLFLWFCACHGWTLQRSRAKVDFADVWESMKEYREKSMDSFAQMLEARKKDKQETEARVDEERDMANRVWDHKQEQTDVS